MSLAEESRKYVVINTHCGLFRYNRMPFGVSSAPGVFQRVMENLLKDIPKVVVYLDDILITGEKNLEEVLQRLAVAGLHLKQEKCTFLASQLLIWDSESILRDFTQLLRRLKQSKMLQSHKMNPHSRLIWAYYLIIQDSFRICRTH